MKCTVIERVTNGLLAHSNRAIDWLNGSLSFPNGEHKQANGLLTSLNRSIEWLNRLLSIPNRTQMGELLMKFSGINQLVNWFTIDSKLLIKNNSAMSSLTHRRQIWSDPGCSLTCPDLCSNYWPVLIQHS